MVCPDLNIDLRQTFNATHRYPKPRPETKIDILQRTLALYPDIAPPEIRAKREATIEDIEPLIVEEGCGFRPARKGGIRMETEWREVPGSQGRKVPVIFSYGYVEIKHDFMKSHSSFG